MAGAFPLYMANTNRVQATITDPTNGDAAVTDASPGITIKTVAGVNVTGETWPVSMSHEGSGVYAAEVSKDMSLTELTAFIGHVEDSAKGLHVEVPYVAVKRVGTDYSQELLDSIAATAGIL